MRRFLLAFTIVFSSNLSFAQWSTDPAVNTPICSTPPTQAARSGTVVTIDGAGSMFIAWLDSRNSGSVLDSVYVQKVNLANSQIFAEDGLFVASSASAISNLSITPDGAGGVLLAWQSNNDIFGQRVSAAGTIVWPAPVALSKTTTGNQTVPLVYLVNTTEAMVVFQDNRNGNIDLFVNKITVSDGTLPFANDVAITTAAGTQNQQSIFPDLAGGLYISWSDGRTTGNIDLFAMHVKNDGTPETGWTADGTLICNATGTQSNSIIGADGSGGVYIVWEDFRAGNTDIYAQRLTAAGSAVWATANGTSVCTAANNQQQPQAIPTNNGIIITWTDARVSTSDRNIFAHKLAAADGSSSWATANGTPICEATGNQPSSTSNGLKIVSDGSNGAIIVWNDARAASNNDIYAQRVNATGTVQWPTANGVIISSAPGNQGADIGVVATPTNGAYIVWQDSRSGTTNGEIYGAVVNTSGNLITSVRERNILEGNIKAYPIPATNNISLALSNIKSGTYLLQVVDITGRILLQHKSVINSTQGIIQTNVELLQKGSYHIRLIHETSRTESIFKFTKL